MLFSVLLANELQKIASAIPREVIKDYIEKKKAYYKALADLRKYKKK